MVRAAVRILSRPVVLSSLAWSAAAVTFALIAWGGLAPQDPMPRLFAAQDKLEHVTAFMMLAGALTAAAPWRSSWGTIALGAALAISIEFGQAIFTLHRQPSPADAAAGVFGTFLGVAAGQAIRLMLDPARRSAFLR